MTETSELPSRAEAALQELLTLRLEQRLVASERLVADAEFEPTLEQQQEWDRRVARCRADPALTISLEESLKPGPGGSRCDPSRLIPRRATRPE